MVPSGEYKLSVNVGDRQTHERHRHRFPLHGKQANQTGIQVSVSVIFVLTNGTRSFTCTTESSKIGKAKWSTTTSPTLGEKIGKLRSTNKNVIGTHVDAPKNQLRERFRTSSDFVGEYLRNGLRCRTLINYNPSHAGRKN